MLPFASYMIDFLKVQAKARLVPFGGKQREICVLSMYSLEILAHEAAMVKSEALWAEVVVRGEGESGDGQAYAYEPVCGLAQGRRMSWYARPRGC
jgi:hypothetical protein